MAVGVELLYDGHSMGFLQLAPNNLGRSKVDGLVDKLFGYFSLKEDRAYHCCVPVNDILDPQLLDLLEAKRDSLPAHVFWEDRQVALDGYTFKVLGKDPFSALRNTVTFAFRKSSLRKPEMDPDTLIPFWTESYYKGWGASSEGLGPSASLRGASTAARHPPSSKLSRWPAIGWGKPGRVRWTSFSLSDTVSTLLAGTNSIAHESSTDPGPCTRHNCYRAVRR